MKVNEVKKECIHHQSLHPKHHHAAATSLPTDLEMQQPEQQLAQHQEEEAAHLYE